MIYGDPKGMMGFQPQVPRANQVQECNGTGMGFTLFDLELFKDDRSGEAVVPDAERVDTRRGSEGGHPGPVPDG